MTSDEIIGFKKSSKINGLKLDETCRTPNSYFNSGVLIFIKSFLHVHLTENDFYPSATSNTIITLNPTAKNTVPILECLP